MFTIHRKQISPGTYEYRYGNDAGEDSGHVFISKSKKLYTHVRWFKSNNNGTNHECFQLCADEQRAMKASKSRWTRGPIAKIIDTSDAITSNTWTHHRDDTTDFYYRQIPNINGWPAFIIAIDEADAWADIIPNHPATIYIMAVQPSMTKNTPAETAANGLHNMADCNLVDIEADGHYVSLQDALNDPAYHK